MTVYWSKMGNLTKSHPAAYSELKRGSFAVQRSDNAFAQVAVDHAIEQTINQDSKTHGGIIPVYVSKCEIKCNIVEVSRVYVSKCEIKCNIV